MGDRSEGMARPSLGPRTLRKECRDSGWEMGRLRTPSPHPLCCKGPTSTWRGKCCPWSERPQSCPQAFSSRKMTKGPPHPLSASSELVPPKPTTWKKPLPLPLPNL